jgi:hypothetical protein
MALSNKDANRQCARLKCVEFGEQRGGAESAWLCPGAQFNRSVSAMPVKTWTVAHPGTADTLLHVGRIRLVRMRLDKMTPEQRSRFESDCADQKARRKFSLPITCMVCDKVVLDLDTPAGGRAQLSAGAVGIPFFGHFCGQGCANAFEGDYGILFKRNATGQISYD